MKNFVFLIISSLFAFSVQAQKVKQKGSQTKVKTETVKVKTETVTTDAVPVPPADALKVNEETHDFGKIPQGKPVTYDFVVTNTGTTPLKIANVQASCGCTTPNWNRDSEIAPGASEKINVGYNAHAEGPFNKLVTITYNGDQSKIIYIKGEVYKAPESSAPENAAASEIKN